MNSARIVEVYSFGFGKNFFHLIGVKGGDSSGKSVSRCDPTVSFAIEEANGPPAESVAPVTEIERTYVFRMFVFPSVFMNYEIDSPIFYIKSISFNVYFFQLIIPLTYIDIVQKHF